MAAVAAMENLKRAVRAGDMKALSAGRLDELRLELNEGVYPDHYAALHWACHYRNAEAMQHFLDLGGVRSAQDWMPAHVCAIRGCAICLQILKDAGVDLSARDKRVVDEAGGGGSQCARCRR